MFRLGKTDYGKPWLMEETALASMLLSAADRSVSVEAIARERGKEIEGNYLASNHDGVAVIQVSGPLMRHLDFWGWLSGYGSYEAINESIVKAVADPAVTAVVLDVDSPGGDVTGCSDLAELIYRLRGQKPLIAYATGDCASAAYWVASACDRIIVSSTARVGSIGCRAAMRDYSAAEQKIGIKTYEFISSVSPAKNSDPATDEGAARIQATVDALGKVFVAAVARNRGVSEKKVLQDYGQGDVMVGASAVEAGLADGIGTLDDVIEEYGSASAAAEHGDDTMPILGANTVKALRLLAKAQEEDEKVKNKAAEDEEDEASEEEDESASEEDETASEDEDETAEGDDEDEASEDEDESAEDEAEPKGKAKAKGERGRIAAILNSPHAKGRSSLAKHLALNTGMSAKAAASILKASPKASGTTAKGRDSGFAAAMSALKNPDVGSGKGKQASEADKGAQAIAEAARLIGLAN